MTDMPQTESEWRAKLDPEQFRVLRQGDTERAFSGKYWDTKTPGVYRCAGCGEKLFSSDTKFASGSGWPSFYQPLDAGMVDEESDDSYGMVRTEIKCHNCGRPPRSRLRRRTQPDRPPLLRQLCIAGARRDRVAPGADEGLMGRVDSIPRRC